MSTHGELCNAIRAWKNPDHMELSTVLAVLSGKVHSMGCLTDRVSREIIESLDDLADLVDQDMVNQGAEK